MYGKMVEYTDEEIIKGIILQNEDVLRFMYAEYFKSVKNMVRKYGGSEDDAWDLFQDTMNAMIDILEIKGESLQITESFRAFFVELSRRIWIKTCRNRNKMVVFNSEFVHRFIDNSDEIAAETYMENVLLRAYMRSLRLLKPSCRKIIRLIEKEKSNEVILNRMKFSSIQAIYNKKRSCIRKLISLIKDDPEYKNLIKHGKP